MKATLIPWFLLAVQFVVMSEAHNSHRRRFLRLFLIRHGETESNVKKIVIGQSESPLTRKGIEQARALGISLREHNDKPNFWRIYSSDLQRAQHTTRLLLDEIQKQSANNVRLEARLRELARGAREGLPKVLSEMQAFSERERLGILDPIPPFETPQEGWTRVSDWLEEVIEDAFQENLDEDTSDNVLNVLVVSHSGLLRVFLERLLGRNTLQQHPDAKFEERSGVQLFSIPNTSLTILKIDVSTLTERSKAEDHSSWAASDAVQIEQLANTEHYSRMQEPAVAFQPAPTQR